MGDPTQLSLECICSHKWLDDKDEFEKRKAIALLIAILLNIILWLGFGIIASRANERGQRGLNPFYTTKFEVTICRTAANCGQGVALGWFQRILLMRL